MMTVLLIGLLLLLSGIVHYEYTKNQQNASSNWKQQLEAQNQGMQSMVDNPDYHGNKTYFANEMKITEYRIAHDMNPNIRSLWSSVSDAANLIQLITIFTIIVAADMIASEFTWGTIKMLLIRPVYRYKILWAKYVASLTFAMLMLAILFVLSIIVGLILYHSGAAQPDLYVGSDGMVHERSMVFAMLQTYGLKSIDLIMMVTFAFMISAGFRSSALAIGLSIFLLFAGSSVVQIMGRYFTWTKYILFANTDLTQYIGPAAPMVKGMTMGFSITMLIIYFIIFNFVSWLLFTRRDVTA